MAGKWSRGGHAQGALGFPSTTRAAESVCGYHTMASHTVRPTHRTESPSEERQQKPHSTISARNIQYLESVTPEEGSAYHVRLWGCLRHNTQPTFPYCPTCHWPHQHQLSHLSAAVEVVEKDLSRKASSKEPSLPDTPT